MSIEHDPRRGSGKDNNRNSFMKSAEAFSVCIAILATFMCAPYIDKAAWPLVEKGLEPELRASAGDLIDTVFTPVVWLATYFGLRASLSVAITAGAIAFAARFLV